MIDIPRQTFDETLVCCSQLFHDVTSLPVDIPLDVRQPAITISHLFAFTTSYQTSSTLKAALDAIDEQCKTVAAKSKLLKVIVRSMDVKLELIELTEVGDLEMASREDGEDRREVVWSADYRCCRSGKPVECHCCRCWTVPNPAAAPSPRCGTSSGATASVAAPATDVLQLRCQHDRSLHQLSHVSPCWSVPWSRLLLKPMTKATTTIIITIIYYYYH